MGIITFLQIRHARLTWLSSMLVLLLQRTPVLRLFAQVNPGVVFRSGQVLRALVPAAIVTGGVNTLTGATKFTANPVSPASATSGTSFTMAFAVTGAPSTPHSYYINGPLPAGLSVPGATVSGTNRTLNATTGTISGTPTESGSFSVSIRAYEKANLTGEKGPIYTYTINVTGAATSGPSFGTQPATQTVTAGGTATFTVTVTGSPTPTLQWRKNGTNLAGKTSATLTISNVSSADAGNYDCRAISSAGTATSSVATLTVNAAAAGPSFTTQPAAQSVAAGGTATFTVAVSGSPSPTLQWRKDGTNLAGQTGTTLTITNAGSANEGSYDCVASNSAGSATSSAATLAIASASGPTMSVQPVSMTSLVGSGAFFSAQAIGTGLTYQWYHNGASIPGATDSTLQLADVAAADAGAYTVVVTDGTGAQITSDAANLNIVTTGSSRLINLSTRAGVGIGSDVLIPGFVIQGDVALTLLVRAVGPRLAMLDVPDVLNDPQMTLYRGPTPVASNDNWEDNSNVAAISQAFSDTGAFSLASGSKDAALLVTLNPGLYTVVVTGKDGATGNALVELYVVDP